jgi:hypothetical protein
MTLKLPVVLLATTMTLTAAGVVLAADPHKKWIDDAYRYNRRAVNEQFDRREDALRDHYKALRDHEKEAWKHARKHVSPEERKYLDREYHDRRKALNREFDARREALERYEDHTRDALKDDYRRARRIESDLHRHDVHRYEVLPPYADEYRGSVYDDRAYPYSYAPQYEGRAVSYEYVAPARPRDIVLGILQSVLN